MQVKEIKSIIESGKDLTKQEILEMISALTKGIDNYKLSIEACSGYDGGIVEKLLAPLIVEYEEVLNILYTKDTKDKDNYINDK